MKRFEITYDCRDSDWLSWRVDAADFHEAVWAAMQRLLMAASDTGNKLQDARLLRIQEVPAT